MLHLTKFVPIACLLLIATPSLRAADKPFKRPQPRHTKGRPVPMPWLGFGHDDHASIASATYLKSADAIRVMAFNRGRRGKLSYPKSTGLRIVGTGHSWMRPAYGTLPLIAKAAGIEQQLRTNTRGGEAGGARMMWEYENGILSSKGKANPVCMSAITTGKWDVMLWGGYTDDRTNYYRGWIEFCLKHNPKMHFYRFNGWPQWASTDLHLWAERFDRQLKDIFQLQDEITYRIAATVAPELEKVEAKRISTKHPHNLDAWDYYQRGASLLFEFSKQGNDQARKMFLAAIEMDLRYSKAHTGLAYSYHRDLFWNYADDRLQWIEWFLQAARNAVKHDDTDSSAHLVLGYAYMWDRQYDLAIAAEQRAVTLHPGNAFAHVALGEALDLSGDPRQAIPHMQAGIEMNENDPRIHTFIGALARTWINARDYQQGEYWARKALERRDDYPQAQFYLAASLGHQGRIDEGEAVLKICHHLLPGWALAYKHERDNEHFLEGLRKAGWSGSITDRGDLTRLY